jgi:hypothetical protein
MTSVLNVDTIADKAGTGPVALTKQSAAKSTLRFDGDNNEIDSSTNVSSVADNGSGDYTASVTNSLNDALYQYVVTVRNDNSSNSYHGGPRADNYLTTTTYQWVVWRDGSGFSDSFYNSLAIHGDLA